MAVVQRGWLLGLFDRLHDAVGHEIALLVVVCSPVVKPCTDPSSEGVPSRSSALPTDPRRCRLMCHPLGWWWYQPRSAFVAAPPIGEHIAGDREQVSTGIPAIVDPLDLAPGPQERLLDDILGVLRIGDVAADEAEHRAGVRGVQGGKRLSRIGRDRADRFAVDPTTPRHQEAVPLMWNRTVSMFPTTPSARRSLASTRPSWLASGTTAGASL